MKVIFLDVDGVLITGKPNWKTPVKHCVRALNMLTDRTGAKIVVSSCWRVGRTVQELKDLFKSWGVTGEVIDRTGEMTTTRGAEIIMWLAQSTGVEKFVIIDDDSDMLNLENRLVQTNCRFGLTFFKAAYAQTLLETRAPHYIFSPKGLII